MATIVTTEKKTYGGGVLDGTQVVGYISSKNRVVRFTFTTDALGASHVSWYLENNYLASSNAPALRWYIGTDPESHANAGASTDVYNGDVTAATSGGTTTLAGSAGMVLLPNKTYYLWIFPSVAAYGYYNLTERQQARVTPTGGAGLVYIDTDGKLEAYQALVDNGTGWDLCVPNIDNGIGWDLHS